MIPRTNSAAGYWVTEPRQPGIASRLRELWQYRHLLNYFALRFLEKNYRRTVLGWTWLLIRPLFDVVVGTLIFGGILNIKTGNVPYFLFYLAGMMSWNLFDSSLMWATRSLELNRRLISRVYFPRLILPLASTAPALLNFAIYLVVFLLALAYYYFFSSKTLYVRMGPGLLVALLALGFCLVFSVGLGLWTSVPGASARDVRFSLRYVLSFWFYLTPVIYPMESIPEGLRWLQKLNPMATVVETVKWGTLGLGQPDFASMGTAVCLIAVTFFSGVWYFYRVEATAVDRL